jgi:hypothetical protein
LEYSGLSGHHRDIRTARQRELPQGSGRRRREPLRPELRLEELLDHEVELLRIDGGFGLSYHVLDLGDDLVGQSERFLVALAQILMVQVPLVLLRLLI